MMISMKTKAIFISLFLPLLAICESPLSRVPKYRVYTHTPTHSVQEHYDLMVSCYSEQLYKKVLGEANAIIANFPNTPFQGEAIYYKGLALYKLGELEKANRAFSQYLNDLDHLKYFYEALQYKFQIAEAYTQGNKKNLLGVRSLPKLVSAKEDAIALYDEIISALPRDEMCATALYRKAQLFFEKEDYKETLEMYQTLIRRFPKHHLAAKSYVDIAKVYLHQSKKLFPNPDFIDLAEINLERFKENFPQDPSIEKVQEYLVKMKNVFANEMNEIAMYYVKKKKLDAATVYFRSIIAYYPDSQIAEQAQKFLDHYSS